MNPIEIPVCSASLGRSEGNKIRQHEPANNKMSKFCYSGPTPSSDWFKFLPKDTSRDLRGIGQCRQESPDFEVPTKPESKNTDQSRPVFYNAVSDPASESISNFICAKFLAFALVYTICGNLFILPICFELLIYLVTEIVDISAKISGTLAKSKEQKERLDNETDARIARLEQFEVDLALLTDRPPDKELKVIRKEMEKRYGKPQPSVTGNDPTGKSVAFGLRVEILELEAAIKVLSRNLAFMRVGNVRIANAYHEAPQEPEHEIMTDEEWQKFVSESREQAKKITAEEPRKLGSEPIECHREPEPRTERTTPQVTPTLEKAATSPLHYILPHDLQTLDPLSAGFTCIGTTVKDKRCKQNDLPRAELGAKGLSFIRNSLHRLDLSELEYLASTMMCSRWHGRDAPFPQYEEVAAKWAQELKDANGKSVVEEGFQKGSQKAADPDPITPVKSTTTGFFQTPSLSSSSSHSSGSSTSSRFSTKNSELPLYITTSLECSPLAAKARRGEVIICSYMKKPDEMGFGWCDNF
jgi:hypothetical protein